MIGSCNSTGGMHPWSSIAGERKKKGRVTGRWVDLGKAWGSLRASWRGLEGGSGILRGTPRNPERFAMVSQKRPGAKRYKNFKGFQLGEVASGALFEHSGRVMGES